MEEEFVTKAQDLINQAYLHDIDNKYYEGLMQDTKGNRILNKNCVVDIREIEVENE